MARLTLYAPPPSVSPSSLMAVDHAWGGRYLVTVQDWTGTAADLPTYRANGKPRMRPTRATQQLAFSRAFLTATPPPCTPSEA